jgi:hypothetical protein
MEQQQTDLSLYPPGEPPAPDDATMPGTDDAPSWHDASDDARTVPLEEFSLTRDQVAAMYAAAGIEVAPRTVARYAKEGILRATMVDAERGLKRYLFSQNSVEEDIAKRLRGPEPIYAPTNEYDAGAEATVHGTDDARSRHGADDGAGTMPRYQAPSPRGDRVREFEIELATMRGRMAEKEKQHEEDRDVIERLRSENGQLRIGIGEYKGRAAELERRLALLEAPKPSEPEQKVPEPAPAPPRKGFWRRITGRD